MLFNEPKLLKCKHRRQHDANDARFSALQRAEIAEIAHPDMERAGRGPVSVLFNEPKLLKCAAEASGVRHQRSFSALQRAEIAEISKQIPARRK